MKDTRIKALEAHEGQMVDNMTNDELEALLASDMPTWGVLQSLTDLELQKIICGDPYFARIYARAVAQARAANK
jgi:hypothetical protein